MNDKTMRTIRQLEAIGIEKEHCYDSGIQLKRVKRNWYTSIDGQNYLGPFQSLIDAELASITHKPLFARFPLRSNEQATAKLQDA